MGYDGPGTGDTLNFEGVNVVEYQIAGGNNPGGIHVKQGDGLTIGGSGTLYFYKSAQGSGIGVTAAGFPVPRCFITDTTVTISGTRGGMAYSFDFAITVAANELNTLEISTKPSNTLYAQGEEFDPTGMVVNHTYLNEFRNLISV